MKKIAIQKLSYENFRGQSRELIFGKDNIISGRNQSGKSTVMNAFLWLFTGFDELDRTNFCLFDERKAMTYENRKTVTVKCELSVDDSTYSFKKEATPGWIRKRGKSEYEKKNTDDYKFYIDDIPHPAGEYKSFVEATFGCASTEDLKMILNLRYFTLIDWKSQRKIIEKLIGVITMDDMRGDYSAIKDILEKYSDDAYRAQEGLREKLKQYKEEIGTENKKGLINAKIEALNSSLPDISEIPVWENEISQARERIAQINRVLDGETDNIAPYVNKRNAELKEIEDLKNLYMSEKRSYEQVLKDKVWEKENAINEIERKNNATKRLNDEAKNAIERYKAQLFQKEAELQGHETLRLNLLEQNKEVKALVFSQDKCPYCGQLLPEKMLDAAREKFNVEKETKHKNIVTQGKANNVNIERLKEEIQMLKDNIKKGYTEKPFQDVSALKEELANIKAAFTPFNETEKAISLAAAITEKTNSLTVIPSFDNSSLKSERDALLQKINTLNRNLGVKAQYDRQIGKIEEYKTTLNTMIQESLKLESLISLLRSYEKERSQLISDKVNNYFHYIHIDMMEQKKDGEYTVSCVIRDKNGVNANVTNTANRILCGMDLSLGLQDFYGIETPLFIDNSGLIDKNNLPFINNQIIKMVNNDEDFNLEKTE